MNNDILTLYEHALLLEEQHIKLNTPSEICFMLKYKLFDKISKRLYKIIIEQDCFHLFDKILEEYFDEILEFSKTGRSLDMLKDQYYIASTCHSLTGYVTFCFMLMEENCRGDYEMESLVLKLIQNGAITYAYRWQQYIYFDAIKQTELIWIIQELKYMCVDERRPVSRFDQSGNTYIQVILALIDTGYCNVDFVDAGGRTAYDYAIECGKYKKECYVIAIKIKQESARQRRWPAVILFDL